MNPLGISGVQSTTLTPCADVATFNCVPLTNGANSLGRLSYSTTRNKFRGKAAYFQASYNLTERIKLTGGIRYTQDTVRSQFQVVAVTLAPTGNTIVCTNTPTFGPNGSAGNPRLPADQCYSACRQGLKVKTSAPTWLIGLAGGRDGVHRFERGPGYCNFTRSGMIGTPNGAPGTLASAPV